MKQKRAQMAKPLPPLRCVSPHTPSLPRRGSHLHACGTQQVITGLDGLLRKNYTLASVTNPIYALYAIFIIQICLVEKLRVQAFLLHTLGGLDFLYIDYI